MVLDTVLSNKRNPVGLFFFYVILYVVPRELDSKRGVFVIKVTYCSIYKIGLFCEEFQLLMLRPTTTHEMLNLFEKY